MNAALVLAAFVANGSTSMRVQDIRAVCKLSRVEYRAAMDSLRGVLVERVQGVVVAS